MLELVILAVVGVAGLVGGMFAGHAVGRKVGAAPAWRFWLVGVGVVLAGVTVMLVGQAIDVVYIAVIGVGLTAGAITGMKYGSGRISIVGADKVNTR